MYYEITDAKGKTHATLITKEDKILNTLNEEDTRKLLDYYSERQIESLTSNEESALVNYEETSLYFKEYKMLELRPEMRNINKSIYEYKRKENIKKVQRAKKDKALRIQKQKKHDRRVQATAGIAATLILAGIAYGAFKTAKKNDPNWKPTFNAQELMDNVKEHPDSEIIDEGRLDYYVEDTSADMTSRAR